MSWMGNQGRTSAKAAAVHHSSAFSQLMHVAIPTKVTL
jgi:hypothetical protein